MSYSIANVSIDSTISRIGDPTYIDCDLGDAYMIKDGTYVGLNKYIDLGSDLPTLASGNNEITFDNTVTELKITPRFWIL
jgi:phage-related protein